MAVVILISLGWLTLALPACQFLNYCALAGGMLLAWRFHSSRSFLALFVLFLAGQAIAVSGGPHLSISSMAHLLAVLVPLDFAVIALMQEGGFTIPSIAPVGLFLAVQAVMGIVFYASAGPSVASHARRVAALISFPNYALFLFVAAGILLLVRFFVTRKPVDAALLWSFLAFLLSARFAPTSRVSTFYSATAACILAASIVENSYLLAYHDELTALPSRRAFNDALLRLQAPYSIAVVDIDHFKRFNDTYGHDTGDQVLRLVARNLARVTGGGEAYRCGGEEFNILFPGKTAPEVAEHLEKLRERIQASEFHLRREQRRTLPRGTDRRYERSRGLARKGRAIRQLSQEKPVAALSVTVSIGVAMSGKRRSVPESVLRAADKALYRAKANGRNRLEIASSQPAPRAKAAEIA